MCYVGFNLLFSLAYTSRVLASSLNDSKHGCLVASDRAHATQGWDVTSRVMYIDFNLTS